MGNGKEDKNVGRWTTFGFDNKENFPIDFAEIERFFIIQTKIVYLDPLLSSLLFPAF